MNRELTNISYIKDLCQRYGFALQKSYGQNFIVNSGICPKIAEHAEVDENCGVIEIGTGIGVLTKELALRAKKVVAITLIATTSHTHMILILYVIFLCIY